MIFNPYQLPDSLDPASHAASLLQPALPQLANNTYLVLLVLLFVMADLLAITPRSVVRYQLQWITDTRNARTFEPSSIYFPWLEGVMFVQLFVSFGLALFCLTDPLPGLHLVHPDAASLRTLGWSLGALLGWYLLHLGLFHWLCYLFDYRDKCYIMHRTYQASFVLLAPAATIVLIFLIAGLISDTLALNLLAALFILSQISFIFNGIKIFYQGFGSTCLIFVYLCALEIAPLLMIWGHFATK